MNRIVALLILVMLLSCGAGCTFIKNVTRESDVHGPLFSMEQTEDGQWYAKPPEYIEQEDGSLVPKNGLYLGKMRTGFSQRLEVEEILYHPETGEPLVHIKYSYVHDITQMIGGIVSAIWNFGKDFLNSAVSNKPAGT